MTGMSGRIQEIWQGSHSCVLRVAVVAEYARANTRVLAGQNRSALCASRFAIVAEYVWVDTRDMAGNHISPLFPFWFIFVALIRLSKYKGYGGAKTSQRQSPRMSPARESHTPL